MKGRNGGREEERKKGGKLKGKEWINKRKKK